MRVCLAYTSGLVPSKGGGIASVINNIVKHAGKKIDFTLLTVYDKSLLREIQENYPSTVKIEYVKPADFFAGLLHYSIKKVDDFDILHFHDFPIGRDLPLALKAQFRRKNLVYSHHISREELFHNRLALGYYYSGFNWLGRILKKVVTNSQFMVNNDLARFRNLQHKIHIIRNGVDVELIRRAQPIVLEGDPSFLFVGHLVHRKGIDSLLEAFNTLSTQGVRAHPKLHIIGAGVLEKSCKEYVASHGLGENVTFWGSLNESLKFRMLKGADVLIVPSRYEPAGIVVLEGMAAGKPLIATRVGGIPEVIKDGINGILTYPSSTQIATAIKSFCDRRELIQEYGRNNQKAVVSFDWKYIAQSYVKLYDSVTNNYELPRIL